MSYITVSINDDVDIDVNDVIEKIKTTDLIEELKSRNVSIGGAVSLDFDEWELIEAICKNKTLLEADKIRSFFNQ